MYADVIATVYFVQTVTSVPALRFARHLQHLSDIPQKCYMYCTVWNRLQILILYTDFWICLFSGWPSKSITVDKNRAIAMGSYQLQPEISVNGAMGHMTWENTPSTQPLRPICTTTNTKIKLTSNSLFSCQVFHYTLIWSRHRMLFSFTQSVRLGMIGSRIQWSVTLNKYWKGCKEGSQWPFSYFLARTTWLNGCNATTLMKNVDRQTDL